MFGGFLSPSSGRPQGALAWLRAAAAIAIAAGVWVITWIFPLTFMIMMAWGCETHTRQLFRRTVSLYGGEASGWRRGSRAARADRERREIRHIVTAAAFGLSVAIPLAFVAYAEHVRNTVGLNWVSALGLLVAASLVIATVVTGSRR